MSVPIIGELKNPYIIVEMLPGKLPNTFEVQISTEKFPDGVVLAVQCLLQAVVFLMPHAFEAVASAATQALLNLQRTQRNGGN